MAPATIERRRLAMRGGDGQLALEGLTRPRPPLLSERAPAPVSAGGAETLDDLVTGMWCDLGAQRAVACPACGSAMRPLHGARGGSCSGCGTTLG